MKHLIQKRFFNTYQFSISDNKLNYRESRIGNEKEIEIPFENIGATKKSLKKSEPLLIIGSIISILVTFSAIIFAESLRNALWGGFFWAFVSIGLFIYYFVTKQNVWIISKYDGGAICFHKEDPNAEEVSEFITELMSARNKYLKERHLRIDKNLSYEEQFSRIEWLKNIEAIGIDEFYDLHEKLKIVVEPTKKKVGFEP